MNRPKTIITLSIVILFAFSVFQVGGQIYNFAIVHEPYQWNSDMKRLKITTPERGLTFKITISNEDTSESVTIESIRINVRVFYGTEEYSKFFKQINIDYIYLPPTEGHVIFVPVNFGYGDIVGDYRAELKYQVGSYVEQKIEPFPLQFRVLSEDMFQQEIEQSGNGGITINIPIEIKISGSVISVSIVIIVIYFVWKRKKEESNP